MTIQVTQIPSKYYGHVNEHIEFGGIYQLQFKPYKPTIRDELKEAFELIESFAPKEA